MRRTAVFLALATATVWTAKGAVASRKAKRLEGRYGDNFTATWEAIADLYTRIGDPGATGSIGLTRVQSVFLSEITVLPHLPNDNSTGPNWATGERDFYNNFKAEMVTAKLMLP